jgi:hypothetical protein
MYLTFADYQSMDGKLSESEFTRAETKARMLINYQTKGQLQNYEAGDPIWEDVKNLVLELIESGYMGNLNGGDVTSESNDGRSQMDFTPIGAHY